MSLNPQSSYPIPESTQRDCRKIEILKSDPRSGARIFTADNGRAG